MRKALSLVVVLVIAVGLVGAQDALTGRLTEQRQELEQKAQRLTGWNWATYVGLATYCAGAVVTGIFAGQMPEGATVTPATLAGAGVIVGGAGLSIGAFFIPIKQRQEVWRLRRQVRNLNKQLAAKARRRELENRYDQRTADAIMRNRIFVGMAASAVRESWGTPDKVNRTVTKYRAHEQWVYRRGDYDAVYVYVEDGSVTSFQD